MRAVRALALRDRTVARSAGKPALRAGDAELARPPRSHQSIKLPKEPRKRLRLWTAFLDREISDLAEEAIAAHLEKLAWERAERGLPPFPPPEASDDERHRPGLIDSQ